MLTWHFSADYISAIRGSAASDFYTRQIDEGYSMHTQTRTGVPHKENFNCKNLKFRLKFSLCFPIILGLVEVLSQNFSRWRAARQGVIMWVQFLEGPPLKIWKAKILPKLGAISDNFWLWLWISSERIDMLKIGKELNQLQPLPHWAKKIWWTLVHKQKSYRRAYRPP